MSSKAWLLVIAVIFIAVGVALFAVSLRIGRVQQQRQAGPSLPAPSTVPVPPPAGFVPPVELSPQIFLGNPSDATPDVTNPTNYLMLKPHYALAYDDAAGIPRWVGWRVTAADLGDAPRKRIFDSDNTLRAGFHAVTTRDYSGGGFDRGHMCPHSDRAANLEMSYATFCMTNIIPQAPNVNQKAWAQLEDYSRELVRARHDRLYITSGPWGRGGVGSKGPAETVGHGRVTVPARCWKVIVVVPDSGGDDLAAVTPATRVISVNMPNDNTQVGEAWAGFRCSVASIEGETSLHFFGRVTPAVRAVLEAKVDAEIIPAVIRHGPTD